MDRNELIEAIIDLIDSSEIVSIEGYRYAERMSRSGAVGKLSDKTKFARVQIEGRVYYIKK